MRLGGRRQSSNIENQRGGGGFGGMGGRGMGFGLPMGGRGLGCGGLAIVVVVALLLGINPLQLLGGMGGVPVPQGGSGVGFQPPAEPAGAADNATDRFVGQVLATTEDTWSALFQQQGQDYPEPVLVLYDGVGQSGCGVAQAAVGPFYCPSDRKIYLDTSFFQEMSQRFGAPGDFARAYVIAHEVGHHVQTVTGVADEVRRLQSSASRAEGNELQVRMELQADCYAGVWGNANRALLEQGDIQEALAAASAIGDDTLARNAGRRVSPESFTHGTSEQRMSWFQRGYQTGDPAACDTFQAGAL